MWMLRPLLKGAAREDALCGARVRRLNEDAIRLGTAKCRRWHFGSWKAAFPRRRKALFLVCSSAMQTGREDAGGRMDAGGRTQNSQCKFDWSFLCPDDGTNLVPKSLEFPLLIFAS